MMMKRSKRSRFAQERIPYIVYGNPSGVRKLIHSYGFEVPENIHDLVDAARELISLERRDAVLDLIQLHPDKGAILKATEQDSFCGACSSYSYNSEDNYCTGCGHMNYDDEPNKADTQSTAGVEIKRDDEDKVPLKGLVKYRHEIIIGSLCLFTGLLVGCSMKEGVLCKLLKT